MGHERFLVFYLLCGLMAAFAQIAAAPQSVIPCLGASGAIAGVLGAYVITFPRRRVKVLIGCLGIIQLPAIIVIGGWILLQLVNGAGQLAATTQGDTGGVAYLAHVGGAAAGLILAMFFRRRKRVQHQKYF